MLRNLKQTNSVIHRRVYNWQAWELHTEWLFEQEKEGDKKVEKEDSGSSKREEKVRKEEKSGRKEDATKAAKEEQRRKEDQKREKGKSADAETESKEKRGEERRKWSWGFSQIKSLQQALLHTLNISTYYKYIIGCKWHTYKAVLDSRKYQI